LSSITQSAATQATSLSPGQLNTGGGIGQSEKIRVSGGHIQPGRETGEARTILLHVSNRRRRHKLRPLRAKKIGIRNHEVSDAAVFRETGEICGHGRSSSIERMMRRR
jgi:hypothetical protein